MDNPSPRNLILTLFVLGEGDHFQCRLCIGRHKQARGSGYTNLIEHLLRHHGETYLDEFRVIQCVRGPSTAL